MEFVDDFEQDSGMDSSPYSKDNSSKDDTPERKPDDLSLAFESESTVEKKIVELDSTPDTSSPPAEIPTVSSTAGPVARLQGDPEESYDDEPDESLGERLWGLTEMFPDCVLNTTHTIVTKSWSGVKSLYSFSRTVTWLAASTSVILFAPVLFELERAKMDEIQKSQQKQFLLGPSAAMVGSAGAPPPPIPR